jgi:hypothetical protein
MLSDEVDPRNCDDLAINIHDDKNLDRSNRSWM